MALKPKQIDGLRLRAEQLAEPINAWLLQDAAERIAKAGQMTSTAAYELYRARALGESEAALQRFLREQLKLSRREVRRLVRQAAEFSHDGDFERVRGRSKEAVGQYSESFLQTVQASAKLAEKDFTNLTRTLGMVDPFGQALPLQKAYRSSMDFAFGQVISGAADLNTAVRMATKKLADLGVRVIDYESGAHIGLEAAARRNLLSGLGQLDAEISQQNHDELGCNGWEISAHANSAPDHEPIQGRQYSDAEYAQLNGSLGRPIGTLNCGHVAMPIILGVNSPQYTPGQLEQFRAANAEGVSFEGRHYTGYEAAQKRNELERSIQRQKRRCLVSEAAGDQEKLLADKIRLTGLERNYSRFCKGTGQATRQQRLRADGFGPKQTVAGKGAFKPYESGQVMQKLNFAEGTPQAEKELIEKELELLPAKQRELAERQISRIRVEENPGGSGYDPKTKELIISTEREPGTVIHEYGHALERELKLYKDATFVQLRREGIDLEDLSKVVYDETTFTDGIYLVENPKFISAYQGRIYKHPETGILKEGTREVNDALMLEYFSEGYRAYYLEPEFLKEKDPALFDFIGGLLND